MDKDLTKSVGNKTSCYGCGMCNIVCNTNALSMVRNEAGFLVPYLSNPDRCTNCGICSTICAHGTNLLQSAEFEKPIGSYAGWSNDKRIRKICSSGGIGFEIGRLMEVEGYSLCAAYYDSYSAEVKHFLTANLQDFEKSIGSKYLQSRTTKAFGDVVLTKKNVIFGTPCQIDMWRRYLRLRKKEDNFLLIDFFCHGVPSYNIWTKYLDENVNLKQCENITWRDKKDGWHNSWAISGFGGRSANHGYRSSASKGDTFYFMFLSNIALNPACYNDCKYKGCKSSADIRIGDLWGTKFSEDEKGVSALLSYTQKGCDVVAKLQKDLATINPVSIEEATGGQMLNHPIKPKYYKLVSEAVKNKFISLKQIRKVFVAAEILSYQFSKLKKCSR